MYIYIYIWAPGSGSRSRARASADAAAPRGWASRPPPFVSHRCAMRTLYSTNAVYMYVCINVYIYIYICQYNLSNQIVVIVACSSSQQRASSRKRWMMGAGTACPFEKPRVLSQVIHMYRYIHIYIYI